MNDLFYQPNEAYVGDVIPFKDNEYAYLFFLYETRKVPKDGMPWHLVRTKDYVNFEDLGECLPSGGTEKDDFNCYTGSVVKDDRGTYHLFYTGNNPKTAEKKGLSKQVVMHAISTDNMHTWVKQYDWTFGSSAGYEPYDWRDPFVFYDDEMDVWRMLLAARKKTGPDRRRGVTAQCISHDLINWETIEPFWDPERYIAMECPEVFKWNDWWYFVYSEFSDRFTTQYRMAKSLNGPWISPKNNSIDGRAFYAAKSLFLNGRRYFTGWIATKENESDDGAWQWAGSMFTLEAAQNKDGTLSFFIPEERIESVGQKSNYLLNERLIRADGYLSTMITQIEEKHPTYIKFTVNTKGETKDWGVLLRSSRDGNESYVVRVEMANNRLVFDRWPRKKLGSEQWQISGDIPYFIELERQVELRQGTHSLEVLQKGSLGVAILDNQVAMSFRMYDVASGQNGIFVDDGEIELVSLETRG
ncbi:MAG: family 43 glycosylhydrolase [Leuconostoc mesenteroides]